MSCFSERNRNNETGLLDSTRFGKQRCFSATSIHSRRVSATPDICPLCFVLHLMRVCLACSCDNFFFSSTLNRCGKKHPSFSLTYLAQEKNGGGVAACAYTCTLKLITSHQPLRIHRSVQVGLQARIWVNATDFKQFYEAQSSIIAGVCLRNSSPGASWNRIVNSAKVSLIS